MLQERKEINIKIGARIKAEREKAGLTQEKFSELIEMGSKSVSALERGTVGISLTTLKKICTVLFISSDTILFGESRTNDVSDLTARLERLTPEQYAIAKDILFKLLEAFALEQ